MMKKMEKNFGRYKSVGRMDYGLTVDDLNGTMCPNQQMTFLHHKFKQICPKLPNFDPFSYSSWTARSKKYINMSGRQTGSAASFLSMLFLNWRLFLVLSGNLFRLISRRIQLFSQRCENIINQMKESYLAFENCKIEFYTCDCS